MLIKLKAHYLPIIVLALLIIITYWGLHQTFYQQDEWQEIGLILSGVITPNPFDDFSFWQLILGQGRVLSDLILSLFLVGFPFQMTPIVLFILFFHIINTCLVYGLTVKVTHNIVLAFVAAALFAVNAVAHQAVIWVAAVATLPATSLVLLSLISYLSYLETERRQWLYGSLGALFLSLLFKEIGIFLIVLLPLLHFIYQKKPNPLVTLKSNSLIIGLGVLIVLFRISQLFFISGSNGTIIAGGAGFKEKVLLHLFLYPLTGLFQTLVPSTPMYAFAETVSKLQYPFVTTTALADIVPQTIITDLLTLAGSVFLIALIYLINRKNQYADSRYLILAVSLVFLSFLPYAVLDRGGSYMDSRYYYIAAIGVSMIIAYFVNYLWSKKLFGKIAAALIIVPLFLIHILDTRRELATQIDIARQRKAILQTIKSSYPTLPEKTVVYITGNHDYYIDGNKVPFQQGVGYTLMVWYYDTGAIPGELLADRFLWDQGSQGYKAAGSEGFGFFSELPKLKEQYAIADLTPESVLAFEWDSETQTLRDTSNEIRATLERI